MKKLKTLTLSIALVIISNFCFAQTDTIFFNSKWENCQRVEATYYRLIIKKSKVSYLVTDYYISNNKPQMVAQCIAVNPEEKNGKCTYYRENGMKESEGTYTNNKKNGYWIFWTEDGKDSSVAIYQKNGSSDWVRSVKDTAVHNNSKGQPFLSVEQMPEFPGGEKAMMEFLNKNIRYPNTARENGIEGKVVLQFVVNEDGSISDIKVLRDLGGGCTEEAVRVLNLMPRWKPGRQSGVEVKVQLILPVVFQLDNGKDKKKKE